MLQLRETRIIRSLPENVAPGVIIHEEGVPLAYVKVNGEQFVQPCTGASGELFAGFSLSRNVPPAVLPKVEQIVGKVGTQSLMRAPVAGQVLVKAADGSTRTIIATGAPAATEVKISAQGDFTNHADDVDVSFTVQYMYIPSVIEAQTVVGDLPIGGLPSSAMGTIGSIKQANISTNFYDASADWSNVSLVKLGAGVLVPGTAADHVPGVIVKNAPSVDNGFLTVGLNVA